MSWSGPALRLLGAGAIAAAIVGCAMYRDCEHQGDDRVQLPSPGPDAGEPWHGDDASRPPSWAGGDAGDPPPAPGHDGGGD